MIQYSRGNTKSSSSLLDDHSEYQESEASKKQEKYSKLVELDQVNADIEETSWHLSLQDHQYGQQVCQNRNKVQKNISTTF